MLATINQTGINVLIVTFMVTFTTSPGQATPLKNTAFEVNPNLFTSLQLKPSLEAFIGKNHQVNNQIQASLLQEAQNNLDEVKQASEVIEETIDNRKIYIYRLESTPGNAVPINSATYLNTWKLPASEPIRRVPEPTTTGLMAMLCLFVARPKFLQR